ncbi:MAG TPA: DedA family protein [Pyrinomonadaceae bacterium]|jgi:membrane protein DedA with SNARE-associated domain
MSLSDYLLSAFGIYGLPVLFAVLLIGAIGAPVPGSLLLVAAGSFVEQGEIDQWPVLLLASLSVILGDNVGYALGRWGGRRLVRWMSRLVGGQRRLEHVEEWLKRYGGMGIFLSRWLLTPLGPFVNLVSGMARYPWPRFLSLAVAGEVLWVLLYVTLGKLFSDRIGAISEVLGDFTWAVVGLILAVVLGWNLWQYFRSPDSSDSEQRGRAK